MECFRLLSLMLFIPEYDAISTLYIKDSGLIPWNVDDTSLVLYTELENRGDEDILNISSDAQTCCLKTNNVDEENCKVLEGFGDITSMIVPGQIVNMSVIIPTLYPYERQGECTVEIKHDMIYHMQIVIEFDTRIFGESTQHLPPAIQKLANSLVPCDGADQDVFRLCRPYDCRMRHGNSRSWYNSDTGRCEEAQDCEYTLRDPKVFNLDDNKCLSQAIDMSNDKHKSGLKPLRKSDLSPFNMLKVYPVECVHGRPSGSGCECSPGWRTSTEGHSALDPLTRVFSLCATRTPGAGATQPPRTMVIALSVMSSLAGVLAAILLVLWYSHRKLQARAGWQTIPQEPSEQSQGSEAERERPMVNTAHNIEKYAVALVHSAHTSGEAGELDLREGDLITDLSKTGRRGIWAGTCNTQHGRFPIACVQFFYPKDQTAGDH